MIETIHAYFDNKLIEEGYVDASSLIKMSITKTNLEKALKKNGYKKDEIQFMLKVNDKFNNSSLIEGDCETIIQLHFYHHQLTTIASRREYLHALFQQQFPDVHEQHNVFYRPTIVSLTFISTLSEYLDVLSNISEDTLMFRGHASANYDLKPSVFRTKQFIEHEDQMYQEMMMTAPEDFNKESSLLEKLVKMQHYGLPTRLLDLTSNPLVALYFACSGEVSRVGEVIVFDLKETPMNYEGSTRIMVLTSLSTVSYDEKQAIIRGINGSDSQFQKSLKPLYKRIQKRWPFFKHELTREDIQTTIPVLAPKNNKRIVKQSGTFLLFGLEQRVQSYRQYVKKEIRYLINPTDKDKLLKQLDVVTINQASLFPEIDQVAHYVKEKYANK